MSSWSMPPVWSQGVGKNTGLLPEVFEAVAKRWSLVFGIEVTAVQVAVALLDLKLVRLCRDPSHLDSAVDLAGYAAVLRELTRDG